MSVPGNQFDRQHRAILPGYVYKAAFGRLFNTDPGQVNRTSQTRRDTQYR